jgi:CheY-like chemotaxis protein
MDFEMPVLNGPSATKLLREQGCTVHIVGVTGNV